jgi:photosystem II stability/assembly factor-like uncharacterized protein
MSNKVFHFSNTGVSSGQRFYLKDDVAGIFVKNLNINTNFPLVIQDNLLQSSQPSGYLTGVGYSGNYDGGYFLGRTKLSQNTSRLVDSSFGNSWVAKESNRSWYRISINANGKYQTAIIYGGQIYVSSDYGNTWSSRESNRTWASVAISSDGKYQTATVASGTIYISNDYGNTWIQKMTDNNSVWLGIAISSDGKYQTATITGGKIYISNDYGNTWVAKEIDRNWGFVSISSDGKYQSTFVFSDKIYISTDYGNTWTAKESKSWFDICISSDAKYQIAITQSSGQIYISKTDEQIDGNLYVDNLYVNNLVYNTGNQTIS